MEGLLNYQQPDIRVIQKMILILILLIWMENKHIILNAKQGKQEGYLLNTSGLYQALPFIYQDGDKSPYSSGFPAPWYMASGSNLNIATLIPNQSSLSIIKTAVEAGNII